ncbi:TNFAIP3-interacting protein 3 [Sciurus carolinensis]|uniref:TNFAIP3-interacting protein 3 n=1 Tax=Sciurus carolinensis TaxID=30640 RepID=A0AA41MUV8_SCICA|nr:TNFAIP3-interacting protein 3 [Sciurus carolinensis]
MELDNKIRDLIERNASPDPREVPAEATLSHRNACPPKQQTPHSSQQRLASLEAQRSTRWCREGLRGAPSWGSGGLATYPLAFIADQETSSKSAHPRQVHQPRVTELRTKLSAAEGALGALKCERLRSQSSGGAARDPRREEALQDVLKIPSAPPWEDCCGKCTGHSHAAMRTEVEVLRQQMCFPGCICGSTFHLWDPWVPAGPGAVQNQQEHPGSQSSHFDK